VWAGGGLRGWGARGLGGRGGGGGGQEDDDSHGAGARASRGLRVRARNTTTASRMTTKGTVMDRLQAWPPDIASLGGAMWSPHL
jgi:hypothetical protein